MAKSNKTLSWILFRSKYSYLNKDENKIQLTGWEMIGQNQFGKLQ